MGCGEWETGGGRREVGGGRLVRLEGSKQDTSAVAARSQVTRSPQPSRHCSGVAGVVAASGTCGCRSGACGCSLQCMWLQVRRLLTVAPHKRPSASEALDLPWVPP